MLALFGSIWGWIKFLRGLIQLVQFLADKIDEAQFNERMRKIKQGTDKAQNGELDDRLDGGQDVENGFNRHT